MFYYVFAEYRIGRQIHVNHILIDPWSLFIFAQQWCDILVSMNAVPFIDYVFHEVCVCVLLGCLMYWRTRLVAVRKCSLSLIAFHMLKVVYVDWFGSNRYGIWYTMYEPAGWIKSIATIRFHRNEFALIVFLRKAKAHSMSIIIFFLSLHRCFLRRSNSLTASSIDELQNTIHYI